MMSSVISKFKIFWNQLRVLTLQVDFSTCLCELIVLFDECNLVKSRCDY